MKTLPFELVAKGKIITMYDAALAADAAGLNVLPPKEDGSKRPDVPRWKQYRKRRSTQSELELWYGTQRWHGEQVARTGVGAVMGRISGNLELFEFDHGTEVYEEFKALARETGLGDLVERIESGYLEESPNGIHWLYRCPDVGRNTTLARRPKQPETGTNEVQTLIETRGEGGYAILFPSHGTVHRSGTPYVLRRGSFGSIATISPDERRALFDLARTFDQMPPPPAREQRRVERVSRERPGDDYIARATWEQVLEPHGWTVVHTRGGITRWRRPGKRYGVSATVGVHGSDYLYVFSTSTPFEASRGYSKFSAYALLNHKSNFKAAAGALAARGYGNHNDTVTPERRGNREEIDSTVQAPLHADRLDVLMNAEDEPLDAIISDGAGGAILTSDGKGCIAAATGVGKTNLLLRMSRCLCAGEPILGYPVLRPQRVLYLLMEGSRGAVKRRLRKVWTDSEVEDRSRFYLSDIHLDLNDGESLRSLHTLLAEIEPNVLILDPLREAHSSDENDSTEVARITGILDDLIARFGCAILIAHHDRKRRFNTRNAGTDHLRGSTALTGWFSFILSLRPSGVDRLVAEWTKTRDAEVVLDRQVLDFDRDAIDFIATADDRISLDDLVGMIIDQGGSARGVDLIREVGDGGRGGEKLVRKRLHTLVRARKLEEFIAPKDHESRAKSYRLRDGAE